MSYIKQVVLGVLALHAAPMLAESAQATLHEITSNCAEQKVDSESDGSTSVWFNKKSGNEAFCNTVTKITVPQGYGLQRDLNAVLTVGANLLNSNDKIFLILKVQSADQVEKTLRSLTLNTDRNTGSQVTLSGDVMLPEIGSCEKDRDAYISYASTAKIVKSAGDSVSTVSLVKLAIPTLKISKLNCPEPTPLPTPSPDSIDPASFKMTN